MNPYTKILAYKVKSEKVVYQGKRIKVKEFVYEDDEGKELYREHVEAGDAVVILAIDEDNQVFMIQEPRTPINKLILGLPAGQIEKGEEPIEAAKRELEEEIGYKTNNISLMRSYYMSVGYSDEKIYLYLAKDLIKTHQNLGKDENIKVVKIPLNELKIMLDKNEIITASTTIALMQYFLNNTNL